MKDQTCKHEMDKVDFVFDGSDPYTLHYHGYGNYEGSRCGGNIDHNDVIKLINYLTNVSRKMKQKINYKGKDYTREEVLELYSLLGIDDKDERPEFS